MIHQQPFSTTYPSFRNKMQQSATILFLTLRLETEVDGSKFFGACVLDGLRNGQVRETLKMIQEQAADSGSRNLTAELVGEELLSRIEMLEL